MARLYNTFEFVGNVQIPKSAERFHEVKVSDGGWEGHRVNFAIQESKTNSVFLEMYGGFSQAKSNIVKTRGKYTETVQGSKLEIPWSDRLKPETVDMVADFKKFVIDFTTDMDLKEEIGKLCYEIRNLEYKDELTDSEKEKLNHLKSELKEKATDRYEFIHEYDAALCLVNSLEKYQNHKFKITGSVEYQEHKGRFFRKFKPTVIEIVDNEEKNKLRATMDIFFTKDSIDDKDFAKEKKTYINGYVLSYDGKAKKDMFFPQQVVINAQKIDFENEMHVKKLGFLKKQFDVKGKGVFHLPWEVNVFRGADRVDFTFNDLTPKQKEAVEFGYNQVEDFAPKGGMLGETTEENRLVKPILQQFDKENNFSEGAVESSYEVDDLTYTVTTPEQPKEIKKEETKIEKPQLDDLDDLFA